MATPSELTWTSLTRAVNEMKPPQRFIKELLFPSFETKSTRTIELSIEHRGRQVAPFVKHGSEAFLIGGDQDQFYTVDPPMIRIKRALQPSEFMFNRQPGTVIFISGGSQRAAIRKAIAKASGKLLFLIQNAEEYLCCSALNGAVTYNPNDLGSAGSLYHQRLLDAFTIDFTGLGYGGTALLSTDQWDNASYAGDPYVDFLRAQRAISDGVGLNPTHAIFGRNAAEAFVKLAKVKTQLDNRRMLFGNLDLTHKFTEQGAHFMGTFAGIQCWEYNRQVELFPTTGLLGAYGPESATPASPWLLDNDAVYFVAASPAAEFTMYYGAIEDVAQLQGRRIAERYYSKSWQTEDPPARYLLQESHPLPVLRRPGAVYKLLPLA